MEFDDEGNLIIVEKTEEPKATEAQEVSEETAEEKPAEETAEA